MKQGLAFILALLALSLYLRPCAELPLEMSEGDGLVCVDHCTSSDAAETSCPDETPEDPCDPGCSCFCCAPIVLSLPFTFPSFTTAPLAAEIELFRFRFPKGFSEDIWQPPRLS